MKMKIAEKIKKNIKKVEVESKLVNLGSDKTKVKPEVKDTKKVEVKDTKPRAIRDTFDAYHIENGSLASQVIAHILDCNKNETDVTMKDIKNKFGNTFYSIFCRLEERKLAHREGKFLHVHEIEGNKVAKLILPVIRPRVGANDQIKEEEAKQIAKVLVSSK